MPLKVHFSIYSMRTQNWQLAKKYAIIKKSTIFTQFLWELVKMTTLWVGHFDQVSKKLGKNRGFFNNSVFLGHMSILGPHTVPLRGVLWIQFFEILRHGKPRIWLWWHISHESRIHSTSEIIGLTNGGNSRYGTIVRTISPLWLFFATSGYTDV